MLIEHAAMVSGLCAGGLVLCCAAVLVWLRARERELVAMDARDPDDMTGVLSIAGEPSVDVPFDEWDRYVADLDAWEESTRADLTVVVQRWVRQADAVWAELDARTWLVAHPGRRSLRP